MITEAARFNSDIRRMLDAKTKIGLIVAAIAEEPSKYLSGDGTCFEIRNPYEICQAFNISPRFFRKIFKNRYRKSGNRAFVEFSAREIEAAQDALKSCKKALSEYRSDSEAGIYSLVVYSMVSSSTNSSFYGLE